MSLGLWTFFLTYLICIPLGIAKAVRDGSRFDAVTGMVVLVGYTHTAVCVGFGAAGVIRRRQLLRGSAGRVGRR